MKRNFVRIDLCMILVVQVITIASNVVINLLEIEAMTQPNVQRTLAMTVLWLVLMLAWSHYDVIVTIGEMPELAEKRRRWLRACDIGAFITLMCALATVFIKMSAVGAQNMPKESRIVFVLAVILFFGDLFMVRTLRTRAEEAGKPEERE